MEGPSAAASAPTARRGLHWGWTLSLTLLLLAGAAAVVLHSPWLKLRRIEIVGAEQAQVAARVEAAGVGPGAFMIWLRPGEVEAAVAADPWVREVRVERIFPNRLVIEVLEHTPALWAQTDDGWLLVARRGVVLAVAETPGDGLLRARVPFQGAAVGEQPEGPEWAELVELGMALSSGLAAEARVTSQRGELWIEARGLQARLGPATELADKGRVFEALLGESLPDGAVVDLVAPTRPAVTVPGEGPEAVGEAVVEGEDGG